MSRKILLILTFLGILFIFPFIKPESSSAACSVSWDLISTDDRDWSVLYRLRLTDNCPGTNSYDIRVTNRTTNRPLHERTGEPLRFNWEVNNNGNNNPESISVTEGTTINVTVKRQRDVFHTDGLYKWVLLRASNSQASDVIQLGYVVENKPDLIITDGGFNFTGGCINTKSNPVNLTVKNVGWKAVPSKANGGGFVVRVHNGVGDYEDWEVTQQISHNEEINLTSRFSNKINIPGPAGNHTARATVDLYKNIIEEDDFSENNNKATDNYSSSTCATQTPTNPPPTNPPPTFPPPTGISITPNPVASNGWFQGSGGDMRLDSILLGSSNIIPAAVSAFFSETVGNIKHGIVFLTSNFGLSADGNHSKKANLLEWYVADTQFKSDTKELNTSYASIINILRKSGNFSSAKNLVGATAPCGSDAASCTLTSSMKEGIYTSDRSIKITSATNAFQTGSEYDYYLFIINGSLTIDSNINVPEGTFVIFVVSEDIFVDESVTLIEGIYSADRNFTINSNLTSNDQRLIINGSVIANAKYGLGLFSGKRDLGSSNSTTPGVQINYRPDFALKTPLFIRTTSLRRTEVAPGQQ